MGLMKPGSEFRYVNAKHAREHWFVKLGLLLSCLPLLLTMLGVQAFSEQSWSPSDSDLSEVSALPESLIDKSAMVPRKWLRSKRKASWQCELTPVIGESKLKYVRVVGERNSGVDGVVELLSKIFPNVTVGSGFVRSKYWFQDERILDPEIDLEEVLVVVVLRNPYDWTLLMQRNPVFAPAHRIKKHDWRRFVSRLWTTKTSIMDKELSTTPGVKCQAKYVAGEVRPCRQSRNTFLGSETRSRFMDPVYETNPVTHLPLRNVLELRKFKMLNYANMTQWVPHISYLKLEALATAEGVSKVQSVLSRAYNLDTCSQPDATVFPFADPQGKMLASARSSMTAQYRDYLTCNIFWSVESAVFGYSAAELYTTSQCSKSPFNAAFAGTTPLPSVNW